MYALGGWDPRLRVALAAALGLVVVGVAWTYERRLDEGRSAFVRWHPQVRELLAGEDVYRRYEYPNPPLMGLLLSPLTSLPVAVGAWLLFALKVALAALAVAWCIEAVAPRGPPLAAPWAVAGIAVSLRPILSDLQHGNVNILIFFLLVAALRALQRDRDATAGALVGLAAALKITPALLLPYFAYKRWWRACAAFVGAAVVLSLLPALALGFEHTLALLVSYYDVMLEPFAREGAITQGLAANQSLGAVLQRYLTDIPSLRLDSGRLRFNPVSLDVETVRMILRAVGVALLAALAWVCRSPGRGLRSATEYALVLIAMLLVSPRSWKHHYVVMALPYLCLLAWAARAETRWRRGLLATLVVSQLLVLSTSRDVAKVALLVGVEQGHHWAQALGAYLFSAVVVAVALAAVLVARRAGSRARAPESYVASPR